MTWKDLFEQVHEGGEVSRNCLSNRRSSRQQYCVASGSPPDAVWAEEARLNSGKRASFPSGVSRAHFLRPRPVTQPMAMRLALPPAAAVLIDVDT
ncbi:hypothetical protein, partial [Rhizobium sp. PEPV16]|uniref:hypothetical protein n=1 Tax=Rhizobium sp. PEPV16 TaxID=1820614 RepID=UPI001AEFFEF6